MVMSFLLFLTCQFLVTMVATTNPLLLLAQARDQDEIETKLKTMIMVLYLMLHVSCLGRRARKRKRYHFLKEQGLLSKRRRKTREVIVQPSESTWTHFFSVELHKETKIDANWTSGLGLPYEAFCLICILVKDAWQTTAINPNDGHM